MIGWVVRTDGEVREEVGADKAEAAEGHLDELLVVVPLVDDRQHHRPARR
jgi:hypothetical protein